MIDNVTYLQFNGKEFTEFVNNAKILLSKGKNKNNIVTLSVENDSLICRVMDEVSSILEYNIELYPVEGDMIYETINASLTDLAALIKNTEGSKFTIRKYHGQYEFNIIGSGWMPFKTTSQNIKNFCIEDNGEFIGCIDAIQLKTAISCILNYTQEYTYARDRYIQFTKTQMTATSRLSSVVIRGEFADMVLHRDNAVVIRSVFKDTGDVKISRVKGQVDRLLFSTPKYKFSMIESEVNNNLVTYFEKIIDYVAVNCNELYKLVMFSEEYSASKHVVGLTIKDGALNVSVKNVLTAKHTSKLLSEVVGSIQDMNTEAEVSSHNLVKALKLFQDKHVNRVNIYLSDKLLNEQDIIVLFDDNMQAVINISNH